MSKHKINLDPKKPYQSKEDFAKDMILISQNWETFRELSAKHSQDWETLAEGLAELSPDGKLSTTARRSFPQTGNPQRPLAGAFPKRETPNGGSTELSPSGKPQTTQILTPNHRRNKKWPQNSKK